MPPSGFSQPAINGLLTFVKSAYETTLEKYQKTNLSEEKHLEASIAYLNEIVTSNTHLALNGTVSQEGIQGLATFMTTNFRDLIKEIHQGKKKEDQAVQTEIDNISRYLVQFKLEEH